MESSTMNNDQIDWKRIGHSRPASEQVTYPGGNTSPGVAVASVTTPQKPRLPKSKAPAKVATLLRHSDNSNLAAGTVVNIRSVEHEDENVANVPKVDFPVRKSQGDCGGMEMLDTDFVLEVIEDLQCNEANDVVMRKIGFYEILRRDIKSMIDSRALKTYAIDADGHYGKEIQCQAMQELARRTA